jgi:hypothetical protein
MRRSREYRGPVLRLAPPSRRIERGRWRAALGALPGAGTWEEALVRWAWGQRMEPAAVSTRTAKCSGQARAARTR